MSDINYRGGQPSPPVGMCPELYTQIVLVYLHSRPELEYVNLGERSYFKARLQENSNLSQIDRTVYSESTEPSNLSHGMSILADPVSAIAVKPPSPNLDDPPEEEVQKKSEIGKNNALSMNPYFRARTRSKHNNIRSQLPKSVNEVKLLDEEVTNHANTTGDIKKKTFYST